MAKVHILIQIGKIRQNQNVKESRLVHIYGDGGQEWLPCVKAIPVVEVRKDWLNGVELICEGKTVGIVSKYWADLVC